MLLKLFSLGGVVLGPMLAILAEALVAEIVLSLFKRPRRFAFILAGGLGWNVGVNYVGNAEAAAVTVGQQIP